SLPRVPICCGGWGASKPTTPPTTRPSSWPLPRRSARCWSVAGRRWDSGELVEHRVDVGRIGRDETRLAEPSQHDEPHPGAARLLVAVQHVPDRLPIEARALRREPDRLERRLTTARHVRWRVAEPDAESQRDDGPDGDRFAVEHLAV